MIAGHYQRASYPNYKLLEPLFKKCYELLGVPKNDIPKKLKDDMVAQEVIEMTKSQYEEYKNFCIEMNIAPKPMSMIEDKKNLFEEVIRKPVDKKYKEFYQFFGCDMTEEQ